MYNYDNLRKVLLPDGIATDEPVPPEWRTVDPVHLLDLSPIWAITDYAFWPLVKDPSVPELQEYQSYDDPETRTVDIANKTIFWVRPIRDWSAAEIEADIAPKRFQAIYNANRDADAFYNTFIGRREWEQAVLTDAKAFAAGGYLGDVPAAVAAMMAEHAQTEQEAADAIIALYDDINGTLGQMFAKRSKCQAAMRAAMVNNELNAAVSEWQTFFSGLCTATMITPRYDYN